MDRQRVRVDYDQALKRLLTDAHDGFLSLIAPDVRWRGELSPVLPAIDRQADLVWEVSADDGSTGLVHVELQTAVERNIGERMAEYGVLLWRHYHVPVRSILVLLRETGRAPRSPHVVRWRGRESFRYRFEVVRLWAIPQERILERDDPDIWPLAGLMADVTEQTVVAVGERIASAPLPLARRRELASLLTVLASRRLTPEVVQYVLRRNQMFEELLRESPLPEILFRDSPLADRIKEEAREAGLQEGREQGREEGREEGKQQGKLDGQRDMVREALEARFGAMPRDILAALEQANDATLRDVIRHLSAEGLEQVRERLGLA